MPRYDRPDHEDIRRDRGRETDDLGQADYSTDYGYDARRRAGYREDGVTPRADDYGQTDYSKDYAYDEAEGRAYRRVAEDDREYARRMNQGPDRPESPRVGPRSWADRAGSFFSGHRRVEDAPPARRRGPSDRVMWTVIVQRLEDERRLDLSDVEVIVDGAEVTLNGTVRRKEDKRRIEDIADIDGVRHVQNNLRVRDRGHWAVI